MSGLDIAQRDCAGGAGDVQGELGDCGNDQRVGAGAKPKQHAGSAEFNDVDFKLQGIELKAAQPLRASLRNGTVTLDQMHVTGQDTDLRASGTAVVFGDTNPQGGRINLTANGSVSMALANTFDPDLITLRQGDVQGCGGWPHEEAGADGQCAVPECEPIDRRRCEWVEQSERDAGLQRRPAGREEPDGDDGRRPAEDWRISRVPEGCVCGPYGDWRCGAGALQRTERDGECELPAAGRAAVDAALRQRAGDAIWGGAGCGLCGALGSRRRAGAAGSEFADEQDSAGRACYERAAAGLSELVCEAGGLGELDGARDAGGADRAGAHPDYGWQRDVSGDEV